MRLLVDQGSVEVFDPLTLLFQLHLHVQKSNTFGISN